MKRTCTLLITGGILALSAQVGMAAVTAGQMSLSPMIGGYVFDKKEKVDQNALAGGLRAGYNFTKNVGVEALFDYANSQTRKIYGDNNIDMYRYGVEGLYNFFPDSALVPHIAAGAGARKLVGGGLDNNKTRTMLDWGFGAKYFLTDKIALRGDLRHIVANDEHWKNNFEYMVGLYIPFGGTKTAAKPAEPAPAPVAKRVEPAPAPVAKPVEPAPVVKPVEPAPAPVAKPVEPAPVAKPVVEPAPAPVEVVQPKTSAAAERFCSKPAAINIQFDTNNSTIKAKYDAELKTVSDFLKEFPKAKGEISGHTDNVGSHALNTKLSQARAESVRNYIIKKFGIDGSRLSAKGYGASKPVASNKTASGRSTNRRIEAAFSCE
jgi:OOP family OmpA-OmpF porin